MKGSGETAALEMRSDYFGDPEALAAFESYARAVFGLDFGLWKAKGLWDPGYVAFSAFAGDACVASLCVYPSEMRVAGARRRGAQLLTVGTLPEYRGRGIQHELWRAAAAWIDRRCDFAFLFTDDSTAGFYEKLGFRRLAEHAEVIPLPVGSGARTGPNRKPPGAAGAEAWREREPHGTTGAPGGEADPRRRRAIADPPRRKLDPAADRDYEIIARMAREREAVSERLGFLNANLLLFRILYSFREWLYLLDDPPALVVLEEAADRLRIHDVIAPSLPVTRALAPFLASFGRERVEFLFCTDRLEAGPGTARALAGEALLVSGDFHLDGRFMFPSSIRA